MESATETFAIEREVSIAARPETVWKLLTDPAEQSTWWGTSLDFDARPGGPFRVEVIPGHIASGEFVEVAEPSRLVYTWGWEGEGTGAARLVHGRDHPRAVGCRHEAHVRAQRAPVRGGGRVAHARVGQLSAAAQGRGGGRRPGSRSVPRLDVSRRQTEGPGSRRAPFRLLLLELQRRRVDAVALPRRVRARPGTRGRGGRRSSRT